MDKPNQAASGSTSTQPAQAGQAKTIDARVLFGQSNVVLIEFKGECYQLRQTRNGKLILTK